MVILIIIIALVVTLIITFKYPMVSLLFYLMAGLVKAMLVFKFSFFRIVDFTVLAVSFVLLCLGYSFIKNRLRLKDVMSFPLLLYFILAVVLWLALPGTSSPNYGFQKCSRFITLGLVAFVSPIIFIRRLKDAKVLLLIVFIASLMVSIGTIMAPRVLVLREFAGGRGTFLESSPPHAATQMAIGAIIAFAFAVMSYTPTLLRIICLALVPLIMYGMILTKSRGPFLGLSVMLATALVVYRKVVSRAWTPLIITGMVIGVVVVFVKLPPLITERITNVWTRAQGMRQAAESRTVHFVWTLERVPQRLVFGHGTGAWGADWSGEDRREHPHNIILEVLYEQGLVGATIISVFLAYILFLWRQSVQLVHRYELDIGIFQVVHISGMLYLFNLAMAFWNFDLNENRVMFLCAGIVIVMNRLVRETIEQISLESEYIQDQWQGSGEFDFQDNPQVLY